LALLAAGSRVTVASTFIFLPAIAASLLAGIGYFPSTTIRQTGWLIIAQTVVFVALLSIIG
jgi:hypothetical protein